MDAPAISMPVLRFFRGIVRHYFRRQFHGVRIVGAERFTHTGGPLIVYANHGSWWDPMVCVLLASNLMPGRKHYAPMDAESLRRYAILRRVGIFPVEMKSARGAVQFLRTSREILTQGAVLWVTPQGRFVDSRVRPLEFKPGLAALAVKVAAQQGACRVLPLAIEYTFWDERLPECLLRFGEAVEVVVGESAEEVEARLTAALVVTMDALQALAVTRDPTSFSTLGVGTLGIGGVFALGERLVALLRRREYHPEHTRASRVVPVPGAKP